MKLKNKILLILVILMAFICLNATNSFATWTGTFGDITLDLQYSINSSFGTHEDYPYKMLFNVPDTPYYYLIYSDGSFTVRDKTIDDIDYYCSSFNNNFIDSSIILDVGLDSTKVFYTLVTKDNISFNEQTNTYSITDTSIILTCNSEPLRKEHNSCIALAIHNSDGSFIMDYANFSTSNLQCLATNAVFPQPPQGTILAPIVEEVETEKTLVQVLVVLPIVIAVIVGILAVRKAIKVLLNLLKRS